MRVAVWATGIVAGVMVLSIAGWFGAAAHGQPAPDLEQLGRSGDLIALSFDAGEGRQQITVVDARERVMAVYHVDRASGEISLKSVRRINYDLQIEEFNGNSPTPREIRAMLRR